MACGRDYHDKTSTGRDVMPLSELDHHARVAAAAALIPKASRKLVSRHGQAADGEADGTRPGGTGRVKKSSGSLLLDGAAGLVVDANDLDLVPALTVVDPKRWN